MTRFSIILLAACASAALRAQAPTTQLTPGDVPTTTIHKPLPHAVERPPESARPSAQARVNTAQRVAALGNLPPVKELPNFTFTERDGRPMAAKSLQRSTHWLLLYRKQDCLPCDRLMNVLATSESPAFQGGVPYVIVVEGKTADAAARVRANFNTLSQAAWLTDKDGQVVAALKPRGAPVLYAMEGSKIMWSVAGNLGDPARVEKMAAFWMSTSAPAPTPSGIASSGISSPTASQSTAK